MPSDVRQALNVESGLNDGISPPADLRAARSCSGPISATSPPTTGSASDSSRIVLGPLAGAVVGLGGGRLIDAASSRGWVDPAFQRLSLPCIAVLGYALAEMIGGNGFIGAFVAGLAYRPSVDLPTADDVSDDVAELLTMLAFVVFGALVLGPNLSAFTWQILAYSVLSLTAVRAVAVAISLIGAHIKVPTIGFIAWFGPRGIASVLYSFLLLEDATEISYVAPVVDVIMFTVALSVLLHGMTAPPLAAAYGRWFSSMEDEHDEMVESAEVHEHDLGRCSDATDSASLGVQPGDRRP